MDILNIENLSITYDGIKNAVDHVSFSVKPGEIIGIVGESGSGKSTMLHSILNLLPPGSGRKGKCEIFGKDSEEYNSKEWKKLRGSQIAMIFQDTGRYMNPISRVGKQYTDFLKLHGIKGKANCEELEKEMLSRVHLQDVDRVLHSYPFELSGGMRQRVGIAMAMSMKPQILLADEPTSALDVTVQAQVVYEMMELRRKYGTTIVMVTHNMGVASYMSDKIGVMQNGKLVEWGKTEDIILNPKHDYTKSLLDSVVELDDDPFIRKAK